VKIQVLSDLHIEFGKFVVPHTDADLVVFAGDIGVGTKGLEWIVEQAIEVPLIYVLGNHEYYHHDLDLVREIKKQAEGKVHVLDRDTLVIDGVRFLGCTLWTDFSLFGETEKWFSVQHAKRNMSDFEVITNNGRRFTPNESITIHCAHRNWLEEELALPFEGSTVVVTHHFPSPRSIHQRFAKDMLTPAFGSDLEAMLDGDKVQLWIHGHTHDAFDYEVNGTRVLCNPRGYVGYEKGEDFRPDLVVGV
jgi:predicted phosphodiesterase